MTLMRSLLLTLFLLFAQQGSLLHALSHDTTEHRKQDGQNKTGATCEKCIAYSSVGSAINSASYVTPTCTQGPTSYIQYNQSTRFNPSPSPSARSPPAVPLFA